MSDKPDDSDADDTAPLVAELPDIIGSAAGAAFGLVVAGPGGAIAGAASGSAVAAALRYGANALHARRQRAGQALQVAADRLHSTPDELGQRASQDPARLELLARVLEAAGHSTMPEKITALGRVLAAGLDNNATVDEALILATALTELEPPHVQVLAAYEAHGISAIHDLTARFGPVLPALQNTLIRHGLLLETTGLFGGGTDHTVGELGRQCLALLRDT